MLRGLRRLEFLDVIFQPRQCPPVVEGEGDGEGEGGGGGGGDGGDGDGDDGGDGGDAAGEEQDNEEAEGGDNSNDENKPLDMNDPIPSLRRSLAVLLPSCTLVFTNCSVQISAD